MSGPRRALAASIVSHNPQADTRIPNSQTYNSSNQTPMFSSDFSNELKKREDTPEQEREIRELVEEATDIHGSLLWKSPSPPAEALHKLDGRAPAPPGCPGDGGFDFTFGLGLPDSFGKFFHPNELGHETITAFALETMIGMRAEVLGLGGPSCAINDGFKCWQTVGRKRLCQRRANEREFQRLLRQG